MPRTIYASGSTAKPALDVKRSRASTRRRAPFRLIVASIKQMRNGFPQHRFDGARRIAQLSLCFLDRQGPRPQCDTNAFGRTGWRAARHAIGDELQRCRDHFSDPAVHLNAPDATAADLSHEFENPSQRHAFATENVAMSGVPALHGKDQPFAG